jgi:hypothetical protein
MLACVVYALCMVSLIATCLILIVSGDEVDAVLYIALFGYVVPDVTERILGHPDQQDGENGD